MCSAIPDFQTLIKPVLLETRDGEVKIRDVVEKLADDFKLTDEEKTELLPSGKAPVFANRVHWARFHLVKSGLVTATKRGHIAITDTGKEVLRENPDYINMNYLKRFDDYTEFQNSCLNNTNTANDDKENHETISTPDEELMAAYKKINSALADEIIERVRKVNPSFFEQLIIDLLLAMGYGGSREDAGRAIGKAGDRGVDGVIDQDPLGVDQIYIQAKRYDKGNNISGSHIRDFYGALNLKRAQKGIFITSSDFTPDAIDTARSLGHRIVLINGEELSNLMLQYNIGSRTVDTLYLREVSEEYFDEI